MSSHLESTPLPIPMDRRNGARALNEPPRPEGNKPRRAGLGWRGLRRPPHPPTLAGMTHALSRLPALGCASVPDAEAVEAHVHVFERLTLAVIRRPEASHDQAAG